MRLDFTDMSRRDCERWATVTTWPELGDAVIDWLHGRIRQMPGHGGPPCDETIPLIPALEAANLSGFRYQRVTAGGLERPQRRGAGGVRRRVRGRRGPPTDPLPGRGDASVAAACRGRGHENHPAGWRGWPGEGMADFWADACPAIADLLHDAWYVVIMDPEPCRNNWVWALLTEISPNLTTLAERIATASNGVRWGQIPTIANAAGEMPRH